MECGVINMGALVAEAVFCGRAGLLLQRCRVAFIGFFSKERSLKSIEIHRKYIDLVSR